MDGIFVKRMSQLEKCNIWESVFVPVKASCPSGQQIWKFSREAFTHTVYVHQRRCFWKHPVEDETAVSTSNLLISFKAVWGTFIRLPTNKTSFSNCTVTTFFRKKILPLLLCNCPSVEVNSPNFRFSLAGDAYSEHNQKDAIISDTNLKLSWNYCCCRREFCRRLVFVHEIFSFLNVGFQLWQGLLDQVCFKFKQLAQTKVLLDSVFLKRQKEPGVKNLFTGSKMFRDQKWTSKRKPSNQTWPCNTAWQLQNQWRH